MSFPTNPVTEPGGREFASDQTAGIDIPKSKLTYGVDGVATDVNTANPYPITTPKVNYVSGTYQLSSKS